MALIPPELITHLRSLAERMASVETQLTVNHQQTVELTEACRDLAAAIRSFSPEQ